MDKILLKNVALIAIPLIVISGVGINLVNTGVITTETPQFKSEIVNATLIIDYGNNQIETYKMKIVNATVYSLLIQASIENNFSVETKHYEQYQSYYIYSINSYKEGQNNNFWQYYINGDYGTVGASLQSVKEGDYVEWKFQEPKI